LDGKLSELVSKL